MPRKILIVEDDEPILDLMDLLIRKLGHEPLLVSNGPDALEIARREPPALILLDIMMTPINGWEFLERIRSDPGLKETPVIIFSASPTIAETMATMKDPNLSALQKPVSLAELKAALEQHLR
jgi:CheY-like chemotaxis protein